MGNLRNCILVMMLALLAALTGCGSDDENTDTANSAVRTIQNGEETSITLAGGTTVDFPANTFASKVTVLIADIFTTADALSVYYPTALKQDGDILGVMVINTPVDRLFERDVDIQFELKSTAGAVSQVGDVSSGQQFAVYRFDFDNLRWNRWGDTFVTVDGSRSVATGTLPTDGFRGFIGSLAIFRGNDVPALPAVVPTTISGRVIDNNGDGVATDVGLYILVGALKYPSRITNGRVPALNEPTDNSTPITIANTVDSDASGNFTMQIPENLIGQPVSLEFAHEDSNQIQDEFDVLAPATAIDEVDFMVIRYGENNVLSERISL